MGYNTEFKGTLKFAKELKANEIVALGEILGEDCRDHPEWFEDSEDFEESDLTYIALDFTRELDGLKWDGCEKTYNLPEKIELLIKIMTKSFPDFSLSGILTAQGEEIEDRWTLTVNKNIVEVFSVVVSGKKVTCPHCEEEFFLEGVSNGE